MKLGQHFLVDRRIAEREAVYAEISKDDIVLEIGPGRGILTEILANRAKKVIAIEVDKRLVESLKDRLPENVDLINSDVMKINIENMDFNKVVSNLPFEISSPITFKLLNTNFSKAVLIYQKEFAGRMTANPGTENYSRLSVILYYKAAVRELETVPKTAFRPVPKVDASMIEIVPRKKPPFYIENEEFFYEFVKIAFSNRRKKLRNVIKNYYNLKENIKFGNRRIEELSPQEIGGLSNQIFRLLNPR